MLISYTCIRMFNMELSVHPLGLNICHCLQTISRLYRSCCRAFQDHREKWWEITVDLPSISKRRRRYGPAGIAGTNSDCRLHRQRLYTPEGRPRRPLRSAHPRGTR